MRLWLEQVTRSKKKLIRIGFWNPHLTRVFIQEGKRKNRVCGNVVIKVISEFC